MVEDGYFDKWWKMHISNVKETYTCKTEDADFDKWWLDEWWKMDILTSGGKEPPLCSGGSFREKSRGNRKRADFEELMRGCVYKQDDDDMKRQDDDDMDEVGRSIHKMNT